MMHFFTAQSDGYHLQLFSPVHWVMIILALIVSVIVWWGKSEKNHHIIENMIYGGLVVQVIMLYSWYLIGGYSSHKEALPLYGCRIAILCFIIGYFMNRPKLRTIGFLLGGYGAPLALIMPSLDPFTPIHLTTVSYIVGHVLLWAATLDHLKHHLDLLTKENLRFSLLMINLLLLITWQFDLTTQSNYSYFLQSPVLSELFNNWSLIQYGLFVVLLHNVLLTGTYRVANKYRLKNLGDEELSFDTKVS
ncbi:TIGR02206 family membrane protein [Atopobacter phocae]|uniref:YwaF family protein n=1 Tax=Atopobacter phocae TaxID=136492 RepID=UPI0004714495|nr:TIGR02206 family membrane protein [Atopobacter phocae]